MPLTGVLSFKIVPFRNYDAKFAVFRANFVQGGQLERCRKGWRGVARAGEVSQGLERWHKGWRGGTRAGEVAQGLAQVAQVFIKVSSGPVFCQ